MGRPREHDLDTLLDDAKELWVESGMGGVTVRGLSSRSGVSNGAIYHAFGSRDNLLARVWIREAERFLVFQTDAVDATLQRSTAREAVVAAALAPADYADREAAGTRLLLATTLSDLAAGSVTESSRSAMQELRGALGALIRRLAREVWDRSDPPAVTLTTYCVVDLPAALLLAGDKVTDPLARIALERAVRGILLAPPP